VSIARSPLDDPALRRAAFAHAVARGLADSPRQLSCRWLYDAEGSALFEAITALPEYYLTRTEDALLRRHAARLRALVGPATLVELGAGSSTKTRHLLRAWLDADGCARYVPVDISADHLAGGCASLRRELPGVEVLPFAGTYEQALRGLGSYAPVLLLFLGSSLGNFDGPELTDFFARVAGGLGPTDRFLLGVDLVKDPAVLEAAYDDAAGVTARFTKNLFARMNRELGTALDLDAIEHVAFWDAQRERIEIHARFHRAMVLDLPQAGRRVRIARGEQVLVEVSRKFRVEPLAALGARHGLDLEATLCADDPHAFALLLFRRRLPTLGPDAARVAAHALDAVRRRTLELVEPLDDAQLTHQVVPFLSPVVWDLGHVAIFEETWIRAAHAPGSRPDAAARARARPFDPIENPRPVRGRMALPDRAGALAMLREVRDRTLAALARGPLPEDDEDLRGGGFVHHLIARHEAQHAETILQAVQVMGIPYEPPRRADPPASAAPWTPAQTIVPEGPFVMGTDERSEAYDNERPAHVVELPAFRIDVFPVTNAEFLAFVEDGGYRRRECWSDDGWRWLAQARVDHPAQWRAAADGSWHELHFGRLAPLLPDQPVVHVSWFEADAFARWAGKRLPTEAEWEKAAAWDLETGLPRRFPWGDAPWTPARATLDQRCFAPAAAGAHPQGQSFFGCQQLCGDVWEWTASEFLPHPGFVAHPYPEYSAVYFGRGYKVLRGGSWATEPLVIRNTFRNWDLPERRQIFAGFRCAADA